VQAQLKPDTAPKLQKAVPELSDDVIEEMKKAPLRSYDPTIIQEPRGFLERPSLDDPY
jgi:cyanate lyase